MSLYQTCSIGVDSNKFDRENKKPTSNIIIIVNNKCSIGLNSNKFDQTCLIVIFIEILHNNVPGDFSHDTFIYK